MNCSLTLDEADCSRMIAAACLSLGEGSAKRCGLDCDASVGRRNLALVKRAMAPTALSHVLELLMMVVAWVQSLQG